MKRRGLLSILIASLAGLCLAPAGNAQDDCHCDCYFDSDCENGNFCFWGVLNVEDSCWWRKPKPKGSVGAGCDEDYGNFGRCDGICTPTLLGERLVGAELTGNLSRGIETWGRILTDVSMRGGGTPSAADALEIGQIEFDNPTMSIGLWRMATEVLMLSRGESYLVYPKDAQATLWEVGVVDLRADATSLRNGNLAIQAVLAEIEGAGLGRDLVAAIDASGLDQSIYDRICPSGNPLECLYQRIVDIGEVLGRGSRGGGTTGAAGGGPVCSACAADCVPSDDVDFEDLLALLGEWGSTNRPCTDINDDGTVNFTDLIELLARWGPCAP